MQSLPPLLARPVEIVPLWLIERVARTVFAGVLKAHPDLFERLGDYRLTRYCFSPADLPLHFLVVPAEASLSVARGKPPLADARIEGPLVLLLGLLEGRCDGDALFFSRDLSVTGDMEAMLALRNALDDSAIDLPREIGALAGPLSPLVAGAARHIRARALEGRDATWN
ncbi:ubiquinone anaerobic biosynthesis accessory factor UbiT [Shinella zoogloeoides]|jgi:predicted lipid carrier protein YhbT|uniref:SCP2 domain-containing protein n=1 Tax=Shinella zoogloeoides TaxID=352475 RepID=A0A6N8TFI7_SHIZO|nr:SCP2 sterol-binding domain-containing protein [Shinella zoogloeoides]MXO01175.1 SCP2 domain-containing protein [Shinella zoogloeoides]UEX84292.1 SCP2 sterol-binding domain-containing protein [Shinella zoogloeoides]